MSIIRRFTDTLGFLTRLAPARVIPEEEMNRCMAYMAPVGAVLGVVVVLPFYLGLFGSTPWIQAWLMVAANIYLTRGLHFDGLADICDGVTTHAVPERFWEVVKDSHTGAFGSIGLVMMIVGQVLLFHEMAAVGAFGAILWVFVVGRGVSVWLGYTVRHLTRPGLGKLYIDGATLPVALWSTAFTFLLGLILAGPLTTACGMLVAGIVIIPVHKLATHVGGVNGDFLGCATLLGELAAGLGFVLFL